MEGMDAQIGAEERRQQDQRPLDDEEGEDHATVAAWIGSMPHAILLILLVLTLLYHSNLGVNVVLEDYVHDGRALVLALGLVRFAHVAMAVAGIYSIVSLSLGVRA